LKRWKGKRNGGGKREGSIGKRQKGEGKKKTPGKTQRRWRQGLTACLRASPQRDNIRGNGTTDFRGARAVRKMVGLELLFGVIQHGLPPPPDGGQAGTTDRVAHSSTLITEVHSKSCRDEGSKEGDKKGKKIPEKGERISYTREENRKGGTRESSGSAQGKPPRQRAP